MAYEWIKFTPAEAVSVTVADMRKFNSLRGFHFFEPASMRFFNSRVLGDTFPAADGSAVYFVTSERFDATTPRLYTVRVCRPNYTVDSASEFQEFASARAAKNAARRLAAQEIAR